MFNNYYQYTYVYIYIKRINYISNQNQKQYIRYDVGNFLVINLQSFCEISLQILKTNKYHYYILI